MTKCRGRRQPITGGRPSRGGLKIGGRPGSWGESARAGGRLRRRRRRPRWHRRRLVTSGPFESAPSGGVAVVINGGALAPKEVPASAGGGDPLVCLGGGGGEGEGPNPRRGRPIFRRRRRWRHAGASRCRLSPPTPASPWRCSAWPRCRRRLSPRRRNVPGRAPQPPRKAPPEARHGRGARPANRCRPAHEGPPAVFRCRRSRLLCRRKGAPATPRGGRHSQPDQRPTQLVAVGDSVGRRALRLPLPSRMNYLRPRGRRRRLPRTRPTPPPRGGPRRRRPHAFSRPDSGDRSGSPPSRHRSAPPPIRNRPQLAILPPVPDTGLRAGLVCSRDPPAAGGSPLADRRCRPRLPATGPKKGRRRRAGDLADRAVAPRATRGGEVPPRCREGGGESPTAARASPRPGRVAIVTPSVVARLRLAAADGSHDTRRIAVTTTLVRTSADSEHGCHAARCVLGLAHLSSAPPLCPNRGGSPTLAALCRRPQSSAGRMLPADKSPRGAGRRRAAAAGRGAGNAEPDGPSGGVAAGTACRRLG